MYEIDGRDEVIEIEDMPQSSIGAPLPFVFSTEQRLLLGYFIETRDVDWDGLSVRKVDASSPGEPLALVEFKRQHAFFFGPPNDEAFAGHPLASRGLRRYSAAEVHESSWVRALERLNSVHPNHSPALFKNLRHFVFAFHDSTFECVAEAFKCDIRAGPMHDLWPELRERLDW